MAGAGFKTFATGDVLTASDVNTYLMQQTVMVFASAAARSTALGGNVAQGMISYLKDSNTTAYYDGSAWQTLSTGGDITGVIAGTGISGGGTSGDVTVTNSMATAMTTKGDLVPATGSGTFARLAAGSDGSILVANSAASTGLGWAGYAPAGKNAVINGGFDIWQRGTSISIAAASAVYTADRWQAYTAASQASTISRQATGDTTNLPNIQYCARFQRNSGQTGTGVALFTQSFETVNTIPFVGKTVTVSFYARKGADYSPTASALVFNLITGTGTDQNVGGTYTGFAAAGSVNATLTTTWQRFTFTATLGSSITEMGYYIQYTPTGTAGANDYFEITGVQLELGSVATPFARNGSTIQGELAACQRYYYRATSSDLYGHIGIGIADSITTAKIQIRTPVSLRVIPSAVEYSNIGVYDSVNIGAVTNCVLTNAQQSYNNPLVTVTSTGLTQYRPYMLFNNNNTAGYLGLSAEL